MISPELLRRYPFFGPLNDAQLKAIAMIAEEVTIESGITLFKEKQPAEAMYLLKEGGIDLFYTIEEERPEFRKEFPVGEIYHGEPFGISAIIEPYILTSTARASHTSQLVKIAAGPLRALCEVDKELALVFMRQVAKVALERLGATRVQLAAAWA
jgi:CRP/FNR family cyclic AMP-dependent transcriptional regulator